MTKGKVIKKVRVVGERVFHLWFCLSVCLCLPNTQHEGMGGVYTVSIGACENINQLYTTTEGLRNTLLFGKKSTHPPHRFGNQKVIFSVQPDFVILFGSLYPNPPTFLINDDKITPQVRPVGMSEADADQYRLTGSLSVAFLAVAFLIVALASIHLVTLDNSCLLLVSLLGVLVARLFW